MADNDELSYDEISEVRRKENNSGLLIQIRPDFYKAANALMKKNYDARNKVLIENPEMYDGISNRCKKTSALLEETIRIRTNKIWNAALRSAPSGKPDVPDNITEEERRLFDAVFVIAKEQFALVSVEKSTFVPDIEHAHEKKEAAVEEPMAEKIPEPIVPTPAEVPIESIPPISSEEENEFDEPTKPVPAEPMEDAIIQDEEVIVRVLSDIPTFSGPERDYTLKKEDVVRLPSIMASALINRKMAVLVKTTV